MNVKCVIISEMHWQECTKYGSANSLIIAAGAHTKYHTTINGWMINSISRLIRATYKTKGNKTQLLRMMSYLMSTDCHCWPKYVYYRPLFTVGSDIDQRRKSWINVLSISITGTSLSGGFHKRIHSYRCDTHSSFNRNFIDSALANCWHCLI